MLTFNASLPTALVVSRIANSNLLFNLFKFILYPVPADLWLSGLSHLHREISVV